MPFSPLIREEVNPNQTSEELKVIRQESARQAKGRNSCVETHLKKSRIGNIMLDRVSDLDEYEAGEDEAPLTARSSSSKPP